MVIAWLLLGAVLAAPTAKGAPIDWPDTLLKDLDAADAALRGSHPGAVDLRNPGFGAQLDEAQALARSRANRVTNYQGYWWAMKGYAAFFNDGHVSLNALAGAPDVPTCWRASRTDPLSAVMRG